jgi:hypothetical protein
VIVMAVPRALIGRATAAAIAVSSLLTVVGACSSTSSPPAAALVSTSTIGPAGGQVSTSGISLNVPPGALATPTTIAIAVDPNGAPAGYVAFSNLFHFSPDGLTFAKPATLSFATTTDTPTGSVYWSLPGGSGYEALPTSWVGATAAAAVTHFSSGFVGLASIPGADDAGEGGADVWAPHDSGGEDAAPLDAEAEAMGADALADQSADDPIDAAGDAANTFLSGEVQGAPASLASGSTVTVTASEFSSEPDGDGGCTAEQPTGQQQVTVPASALPYVYRFHFYSMTSSLCEGRRYVVDASERDEAGGLLSSGASTCTGVFGTALNCQVLLPAPPADAGDDASDASFAPEASADAGNPWTQPIQFSGTISGNVPSGASFIRIELHVTQTLLGIEGCAPEPDIGLVNATLIAPTLPATYSFTFDPEITADGGTGFCFASFTLNAFATDGSMITMLAGSTAGTTDCGHVGTSGLGPPIQSTSVNCDVSLP